MLRRCLLLTLAALLLTSGPVAAGGWAVTTLDELPADLRAGETYRIGYTLRQHGHTPYAGADTAIEIQSASGRSQRFAARAEGGPGHYVAEVRFPDPGAWSWRVHQDRFGAQELGTVTVLPPGSGNPAGAPRPAERGATGLERLGLTLPLAAVACAVLGLLFGGSLRRRGAAAPAPD